MTMEFSISWLADYLDLHLGAALRSDADQRHSFEESPTKKDEELPR